jgi:ElaB/YqjD/DUF883 family membrane-anchored ribosome-binding protein
MTQATDKAAGQQGLTDQASEKMHDAAAVAQEKAVELRKQGSARLGEQFDQRSTQAGSQVRALADALRRSGNDLQNEGNANGARLAGQAADRVEQLGSYLEQKRGDELMRDVETFARKRPWMLAGLGMLVGVATARFVKASSEDRYGEYRGANQQQWPSHQNGGRTHEGPRGHSQGVRQDAPSTLGDDPLARDPYAGTR